MSNNEYYKEKNSKFLQCLAYLQPQKAIHICSQFTRQEMGQFQSLKKSVDQRLQTKRKLPIKEFWGSAIVKCLVNIDIYWN